MVCLHSTPISTSFEFHSNYMNMLKCMHILCVAIEKMGVGFNFFTFLKLFSAMHPNCMQIPDPIRSDPIIHTLTRSHDMYTVYLVNSVDI